MAKAAGSLACQVDSYLTRLTTRVVSCIKMAPKNEGNQKKKTSAALDTPKWFIHIYCEQSFVDTLLTVFTLDISGLLWVV